MPPPPLGGGIMKYNTSLFTINDRKTGKNLKNKTNMLLLLPMIGYAALITLFNCYYYYYFLLLSLLPVFYHLW